MAAEELFKYVDERGGRSIIESNTLGFRQALHFNDPMECFGYPPEPRTKPEDLILGTIRDWAKTQVWRESYAIASLTRSPTNPLMWAHYAQHKGLVIGYNPSVESLSSSVKNLIPVQYGSVIYTATRPRGPFIGSTGKPFASGKEHAFDPEWLEKLQRVFLVKSLHWSYEEEVRVVKRCTGISTKAVQDYDVGRFSILGITPELFLLHLPQGTIRSITVGINNSNPDEIFTLAKTHQPQAKLYTCRLSSSAWDIERVEQ